MIEAFFCYKFDKQSDIKELIEALPDEIVDHDILFPQSEDYFTEKDVEEILKTPSEEPFDMDDMFALLLGTGGIFNSPTPYRAGVSPLSNGPTKWYDRKEDKFIESNKPFADCAEITARHFLNLILFDPLTRTFNLDPLKKIQASLAEKFPERSNTDPKAAIDHLIDFYEKKQPPIMANAGDIDTRSAFNRVIGDLNVIPGGPPITYVKGTNELETGALNFIQAFQKILSLDLPNTPPATASEVDHQSWAKKAFQTLFTTLHPTRTYELNFNQTRWSQELKDLYGKINIKVRDESSKKELFDFAYSTTPKSHSEIMGLKSYGTAPKINDEELTAHRRSFMN